MVWHRTKAKGGVCEQPLRAPMVPLAGCAVAHVIEELSGDTSKE
jgi:hypothetical protein